VRAIDFLGVLRLQKELYYVGRKKVPPACSSVKNCFVFKDAQNVREMEKFVGLLP
jgi:hypothetical protein